MTSVQLHSCPIASRVELKQLRAAEMGEKELLLRSSDGGSKLCESQGPTESAGGTGGVWKEGIWLEQESHAEKGCVVLLPGAEAWNVEAPSGESGALRQGDRARVGRAEGSLGNRAGIHKKRSQLSIPVGSRGCKATLPQCLTRKNMLTPCLSLGVKAFTRGRSGNA